MQSPIPYLCSTVSTSQHVLGDVLGDVCVFSGGVLWEPARGRELELGLGGEHWVGPPHRLHGASSQTDVCQRTRAA